LGRQSRNWMVVAVDWGYHLLAGDTWGSWILGFRDLVCGERRCFTKPFWPSEELI
jgi:hypothetical protein